jgi:hypothetical protein
LAINARNQSSRRSLDEIVKIKAKKIAKGRVAKGKQCKIQGNNPASPSIHPKVALIQIKTTLRGIKSKVNVQKKLN